MGFWTKPDKKKASEEVQEVVEQIKEIKEEIKVETGRINDKQPIVEEPLVEQKKSEPETEQQPIRKKPRRFRRLVIFSLVFGFMVGSLEIYNKVNKDFKTNTDPEPHFMQKSEINTEISKRGREERIKQIREILHQEVDTEFDNPTKGYDVRILAKQKRIQKEIEDILKLESITEPEKYKEIVDMIQELQIEIDKSHLDQDGKLYTIEVELEKLEKIKHIIDQEIRDLRIYFEKIDDNIEQIQVNKHILPI